MSRSWMNESRSLGGAIALSWLIAAPGAASSFTVNSAVDASDVTPGDGLCRTSTGVCTLRAAIEEANELAGNDVITLSATTYFVDRQLTINDGVRITGAGADSTIIDGRGRNQLIQVSNEKLLVCDTMRNAVGMFDRHGVYKGNYASSGISIPMALSKNFGSGVLVTGFSSGVHRYDDPEAADGLVIASGSGGLLGPTDTLAYHYSDTFQYLVTKFQPGGGILKFDSETAAPLGTFVPYGRGGLAYPNSLEQKGSDVYVTSNGTHQVLRFDRLGNFVSVFASAGLSSPRDLQFQGNYLYVASEGTNSILRYDATSGAYVSVFVSPGSGGLSRPQNITFDSDGDLYVTSAGTKQVLRYNGVTGAFKAIVLQGVDSSSSMKAPGCLRWALGTGNGPSVTLEKITLANGLASSAERTAGLFVDDGAYTTLTDAIVRDNNSSIYGGGISNWGNLTIRRSAILRNKLPAGGGGRTSTGGGIFNHGNLQIFDSLIAGNYATRGGGLTNNGGHAELTNVTVSGNTAIGGGGGVRNDADSTLWLNFSTITANRANDATGTGDEPDRFGGGIFNAGTYAFIYPGNTIIANNSDGRSRYTTGFSPDCYSPAGLTSHNYNLVGIVNSACKYVVDSWAAGNFGTPDAPLDAKLGPLTSTSSYTGVHVPRADSRAIDAAMNTSSSGAFYNCPAADQRGEARPFDGNADGTARCDIGAAERR